MAKFYFDPVDQKVDFPQMEKTLQEKWYKEGIVDKYLHKNDTSEKTFSFLDGPITANNPMGVHHAWGRTYKDLWPRYKNMSGYRQRFQNGFDCQGLWVEVEVEKELGLKSKREIESLVPGDSKASIAKFVELCKERVKKFSAIQTNQSKRLGYFADWDHSYFTMSDENNYAIWHFLKECFNRGWIYKGHDSVPWCPRCETAISQHEILTEDYKELVHDSIYFSLPIKEIKGEYLLVWTTTPWTLPANIAVAVDSDLEYSLVTNESGRKYWIATALAETVFGKGKFTTVKKEKGLSLVGLHYQGPFDELDVVKKVANEFPDKFHSVVATDNQIMPITTIEGTGMVHTAVSAGEEDFKLGKKIGLPMIPVIADNADYLPQLGEFAGKNAKTEPKIIFDYLKAKDAAGESWIFAIVPYKHRYPACWRCKAELVWKVADEWYIAMDLAAKDAKTGKPAKNTKTLREQMIDVAKKIHWIPEFGLDRELDWLNNMHDWLISKKNRYWGLALPIYECSCGHFTVLGGKDELKSKAVEGWETFDGKSPHKPWIDEVKITCEQCGKKVSRILDVGNPWLDAGIVPFSTITDDNGNNPLYFENKAAWEKWFPADFITESFPGQFKNWFYSLIAMSTVLTEKNPFKTVLGFATLLGSDGRPMHKSWGNSIEFNEGAEKIGVDVMRWMYVKQNPADNLIFGYDKGDETRRSFHLKLWNVYNFFVTYANLDGWTPKESKQDNGEPLDQWILTRLSDTINTVTSALDNFQTAPAAYAIETLLDDMSNWYIRRSRDRIGSASESDQSKNNFYSTTYEVLVKLSLILAPFTPHLADTIYTNLTKEESVHLAQWPTVKPGSQTISKTILEDMANIRTVVEAAHAIRKELAIPVRQPLASLTSDVPFSVPDKSLFIYLQEELNVKEWIVKKSDQLSNKFDTVITPELEEEAKTRDLIRSIQQARKEGMFGLDDKANVLSPWIPKSESNLVRLKAKALVSNITLGEFTVTKAS